MTTLIALASKHALVMGTDSLGTQIRQMVDPSDLLEYFDPQNRFALRTDDEGNPKLNNLGQLWEEGTPVPVNQYPHVTKLFRLGNRPTGIMFTGVSSIGDRTYRSLVTEFDAETIGLSLTTEELAQRFLKLLRKYYVGSYPEEQFGQPELEVVLGGYDHDKEIPIVMGIDVKEKEVFPRLQSGGFGVAFAGQADWIHRIVFGTDSDNMARLSMRLDDLMEEYRKQLAQKLGEKYGIDEIPPPEGLELFDDGWSLEGMEADLDEFSEQSAIDCVDFLLRLMIESQNVSAQLPTVGGKVHIAVIRKDGFYPVSKEVWTHGSHEVGIPEIGS